MYVIADIEWIEEWVNFRDFRKFPVQLAAVRVDGNWNKIDEFAAFIKPQDRRFSNWNSIACTGGTFVDFFSAKSAKTVFSEFSAWLGQNDIILWWHNDSQKMFRKFWIKYTPFFKEPPLMTEIGKRVRKCAGEPPDKERGFYKIAAEYGINTQPKMMHNSKNDVRVLFELLRVLNCPAEQLFGSLLPKCKDQPESAPSQNRKADPTPDTPLKRRRKKNAEWLRTTSFVRVYTPTSNIYHMADCPRILSAKTIMGIKVKRITELGKVPCKVCIAKSVKQKTTNSFKSVSSADLKAEGISFARLTLSEQNAVQRHREAAAERQRLLRSTDMTEEERSNVYLLTQPQFAFFADIDSRFFHLYGCPELNSCGRLQGFSQYKCAVFAGYSPCRFCKPKERHNMTVSIPIYSHIRKGEEISDIEPLCAKAGFSYHYENNYFCVETHAGKWRLDITSAPVRLEHINLIRSPGCTEYHKQPRIFLSFADTIKYIKRHDEELEKAVFQR